MRSIENQIKRVIVHKGLLSYSLVHGSKATLNQYERGWIKPRVQEAIEAIDELGLREFLETPLKGRKLDAELTSRGINWLKATLFKKNGEPRNTKMSREGCRYNAHEIVRKFSHFTFDGFESDGYGNFIPRWRVHAKDGRSFSYVCTVGAHNPNGYVEYFR